MNKYSKFLALSLSIALAGCGTSSATSDSLASCLVENGGDSFLFDVGRASGNGGPDVSLPFMGSLQCGVEGITAYFSGDTKALTPHLKKAAGDKLAYKQGVYSLAAPDGAPHETVKRVGQVGEHVAAVQENRLRALSCGVAQEEALLAISDLDETAVLTWVGRYAGVDNIDTAKQTAARLISGLPVSITTTLPVVPHCDDSIKEALEKDVREWQDFISGKHAWSPGCMIEQQDDAYILKCLPRQR